MSKILFVTNASGHGGASRMFIWVANQMFIRQHEVFFYNADKNGTFYPLNKGVQYLSGNMDSSYGFIYRNTLGNLKKIAGILNIIRNEKIDIVVSFVDHTYYGLCICKKITGVKVIASQRVDPEAITNKTGKTRLKLLKNADGIVFQTESARDYFENIIKEKSTVIPNPALIHSNESWNAYTTEDYIVNVARLEVKQKRQDILIRAFEKVHKNFPTLELHLYGFKQEKDYSQIRSLIKNLHLEKYVLYKGITNQVKEVLKKSKVFVLSSDYEGIPNVIIEAMSIGVPVVSTDCKPGGASLLLDTKDKGIIVPCGDVDALANAIIHILENPQSAECMGLRAKESLSRFDEKTIADKWEKFIISKL